MKTTPHGALRRHCIAAAQPLRPDIQFHPQTVGTFRSMDGSRLVKVNGGGSDREEKESRLDEALIIDGSGYAEVEWKSSGDTLRPGQITRLRNLVSRNVTCIVVVAELADAYEAKVASMSEFPLVSAPMRHPGDYAEISARFAQWCALLPRG